MEILIIFGIIVVPLLLIALFVTYKERQEEHKEQKMGFQSSVS